MNNKPTKTKKAMKTKKFLSMAALALVGAMMTGCSNDDNYQQPENKNNVVTLTTTIGLDDGGTTRALTATGVKTFAEGDQIAVIYKNASDETIKTVSTISSGAGTKTATFTVALTNPDNTKAIRYIYPAAMAKDVATDATIDDAGTVDFDKLNNQDGTLTTLGSTLDLCTLDAANWTSGTLPTGTLQNQLAILAINLKYSTDITSSITGMTISDGTNNYAVSGISSASTIYVAIRPTTDATINVTATDGTNEYVKTLATTKTYAANNGYNVTWNMTKLTKVTWNASDITGSGTGTSFTKDGVTITAGNIDFNNKNFMKGGTFTTTLGNFTKIEVTAESFYLFSDTGWSGSDTKRTWAGTPASSVSFSGNIMGVPSRNVNFVFTIEPTN